MIRTLFGFVSRLNSAKVTRNSTPTWRLESTPSTQLWAGLVLGSAQGVPAGVAPRTCTQVALCVCVPSGCVSVCLSVCLLDARGPASFTALTRSFIALAEIAEVYLCLPPPDRSYN